ncbi:MAG: alanine racemase [Patescibacteria group bacterium]
MDSAWIEMSKKAIGHNVKIIRSLINKNTLLAPCIKSNAYGHGIIETAKLLISHHVDVFCIASIEEALVLRKNGVRTPLLIIGFVPHARLHDILKSRASIFVYEPQTARALSRLALAARTKVNVHIKVDTGMGRQGLLPNQLKVFIKFIQSLEGLRWEGIATHFASADEPEHSQHFHDQLRIFTNLVKEIKKDRQGLPLVHCANSAATLLEPKSHFDMVRPGLAVYGYYPSERTRAICLKQGIKLQPTLSFKTKAAAVKKLPKGACVSYNCTFTTKQPAKIAVLPVGYYDGIDRGLSNRGHVLIRGKRAPILGRVCMNITVVDVTHIPNIQQEDEVVIIGTQGKEEITVEEIARRIGTINYEVTTRLRESIRHIYI